MSSSVSGISSGLDTAGIIKSLMAIKHQKVDKLLAKKDAETAKQSTWSSIMSNVLGLQLSAYNLSKTSTFNARKLNISNEAALSATASGTATTGSYQFMVDRLATAHQLNSVGFHDYNTTPVGAGTMTFEMGNGDVKRSSNLNDLNGGTGVTRGKIKITDRDGLSATVDLTHAMTLDDVLQAINTANLAVTANINSTGNGIDINATGLGAGTMKVEETSNGTTAADLGIKGSVAGPTLAASKRISYLTSSSSLSTLNDGVGVDKKGVVINGTAISLATANTLGEAITLINAQTATTTVTAALRADGKGISLAATPALPFTVAENGGTSAKDLGILALVGDGDGLDVLAGMNSVLLKNLHGGTGITGTSFIITGVVPKTITITGFTSLNQVIDAINVESGNTNIVARYNQSQNGLELYRTDGLAFTVANDVGTPATDLGIVGASTNDVLKGTDLNVAYLGTGTELATMNQGDGVRKGSITITNKAGSAFTVNLNSSSVKTLGDVMDNLNATGASHSIAVTLNATGDGLLITDTSGGSGNLTIADASSGSMAKDLGILGTSTGLTYNGSFQKSITVSSTNTLENVRDAINALGLNLKASVVNDGSNNPYRLSIASTKTGFIGRMIVGSTISNLNLNTSVSAQNATLIMGDPTAENALFMSTSTNSVKDFIPGLTLDLKAASANPITLSVETDPDAIVTGVKDFSDKYNKAISAINEQLRYDAANKTSGPLFGDSTLMLLQQQIYGTINREVTGVSGTIKTASQVGMNLGMDGSLTIDTAALTSMLNTKLSDVVDFFTFQSNAGLAATPTASATDAPWTLAGGHDGNSRIADYASGTTGWQSDNGASYALNLGSKKELTSIRVSGVDTAVTDILKSFDVQYMDPLTSSWKTYASVANNTNKDISIFFPTGIVTDQIRLNNMQSTGTKAKILDFQAMESTGFASIYDLTMSKITNSGTGMIASAIDGSVNNQTTLDQAITSINERLAIEEEHLRAQYTKLETMLSNLKNQSSSFNSQMSGINSSWGK